MGNEKREKIITGNKVSKGCRAAAEEEEEEEEEQKIEKFYALIRSFRDARDHRRNELKQMEIINKKQQQQNQMMILKKRKLAAGEQQTLVSNSSSSSLVPSFRMEDFTQQEGAELLIKWTPLLKFPAAPSCFNKNHQPPNNDDTTPSPNPNPNKDDESAGLDLKLAL